MLINIYVLINISFFCFSFIFRFSYTFYFTFIFEKQNKFLASEFFILTPSLFLSYIYIYICVFTKGPLPVWYAVSSFFLYIYTHSQQRTRDMHSKFLRIVSFLAPNCSSDTLPYFQFDWWKLGILMVVGMCFQFQWQMMWENIYIRIEE